ncbi:MAG: DNA-directed RNA polymerase subunit omega, partial [Atopobium minutum]|nr:DNA-directed RNA polymerase subunit omega [Atopobium minutum]
SIASKRACDINDMLRDQHLRVTAVQAIDDITTIASGKDSIGIAMSEISEGSLSFVKDAFDEDIKGANSKYDQID